jgi:hypothetical protein
MDIIIFGTVYNYKFTTFFLLRPIIDNLFQLVSRSNYNHMFTLSSDKGPPLKCWLTITKKATVSRHQQEKCTKGLLKQN